MRMRDHDRTQCIVILAEKARARALGWRRAEHVPEVGTVQ